MGRNRAGVGAHQAKNGDIRFNKIRWAFFSPSRLSPDRTPDSRDDSTSREDGRLLERRGEADGEREIASFGRDGQAGADSRSSGDGAIVGEDWCEQNLPFLALRWIRFAR